MRAADTVVRLARGVGYPFRFDGGVVAFNLPIGPTDSDVDAAVAQGVRSVVSVSDGEMFFAREMDGGIDRSVFGPGSEEVAAEALSDLLAATGAYLPWIAPVVARVSGDAQSGDLEIEVGYRLAADATPGDSRTPSRVASTRPWGGASGAAAGGA